MIRRPRISASTVWNRSTRHHVLKHLGHLTLLFLSALPVTVSAAWKSERTVTSPDGAISLVLERDDATGRFAWSVTRDGRPVVTRGSLGIELAGVGVVADEGTVASGETRSVDATWAPPYGEHAEIPERFNEQTWTLSHSSHGSLTVRVQTRVYNEGAALRYMISGKDVMTSISEKTSFPLPPDTHAWVSDRAQSPIRKVAIGAAGRDLERPLTAEIQPGLFAAFGEAGLRDHARMKFTGDGASTLVPSLAGPSTATGSLVTPWRYVRTADTPAALLNGNHFMLNLNAPSETADTSWLRPGKVLREVTLTTKGGIACVDWAAAHGIDFILFDAGWYGHEYDDSSDATTVTVDPKRSPGTLDLQAVIHHARSRNIGVILYVNRRALETQLDKLLPLYQKWGVAGIKFGFVQVGPQQWTRWLHDAVARCAEHRLMVDVHDEYRMTGVERTLPNLMTAEGIRGDEESPSNEMVLHTIFTRGLAGAADQTNCYLAPRVPAMGSHASQLAKSVLIYSPWQFLFWYDRPPLPAVPELTFFKRLPTVWDETRWLDGHPDSHAVVARRKGGTWFVGALNGNVARDFKLALDFLPENRAYRMELFYDDPGIGGPTKVRIETGAVQRDATIKRQVAARNGFAAILTPHPQGPTP